MLNDPFDKWPKRNESWKEMQQRHKKDNDDADKVAILTLCLILLPFVGWLFVDVIDKAVK
jgi:hypothetical protein